MIGTRSDGGQWNGKLTEVKPGAVSFARTTKSGEQNVLTVGCVKLSFQQ